MPEVAERPLPEKMTIFDAGAAAVSRRSRPDFNSPLKIFEGKGNHQLSKD